MRILSPTFADGGGQAWAGNSIVEGECAVLAVMCALKTTRGIMQRKQLRLTMLIATVAASALALTGCSGAAEADKVKEVSFDQDTARTPGNVVLPFGEPALIVKDDAEGTPSALVSVLQITEGDPKIFEEWDDGAQFKGSTPFYMVVQTQNFSNEEYEFAVFPENQDGKPVAYVATTFGSSSLATGTAECPILMEAPEDAKTRLSCIIALADEGDEVTGGIYTGEGFSGFGSIGGMGDATYGTAPIRWSASATSADIDYAVEAIDMGAVAAATAPGTKVPLATPAWLPVADKAADVVGVSVLAIVPGDASYFEKLDNASDFAGLTPSFIVVQYTYPDDATFAEAKRPPLYPVASNGDYAQWMTDPTGFSLNAGPGLNQCGLILPVADPDIRTEVKCITALTEDGKPAKNVEFNGESYSALIAKDALGYFSAPVILG